MSPKTIGLIRVSFSPCNETKSQSETKGEVKDTRLLQAGDLRKKQKPACVCVCVLRQ